MPYDGSGNFVRSFPPGGWQGDATGGIKILASRHDQHDNDIAAALSLALTRDGQSMPTADINWNGKKIINLAAPIAGTDAANKAYVDGIRTFSTPIVISGSHPNAQLKFTGTTGPWGDSYVTADGAAGMRGIDWVWNDKADFSGNDVMKLSKAGVLTIAPATSAVIVLNKAAGANYNIVYGRVGANLTRWGLFLGDATAEVAVTNTSVGSDFAIMRYDDTGALLGQALVIKRSTGLMTIGGAIASPVTISGAGVTLTLDKAASGQTTAIQFGKAGVARWVIHGADVQAETGSNSGSDFSITRASDAGGYIDTPFTIDRGSGRATFGALTNSVAFQCGAFSGSGATLGIMVNVANNNNLYSTSVNTTAGSQQIRLFNPNGMIGQITTTNSATTYGTTSDENLKEYNADMDPADAIAIIRADPVLAFTWKVDGEEDIGWFAQKSYAVDPSLAVPPPEPAEGEAKPAFGSEGYVPWGIDYGKRTPYLWAALTWALDQIDQLTARVAALESPA